MYPTLEARLTATAGIMHNPSLASGILKVQDQREMNLTLAETKSLQPLKAQGDSGLDKNSEEATIIDRAMK